MEKFIDDLEKSWEIPQHFNDLFDFVESALCLLTSKEIDYVLIELAELKHNFAIELNASVPTSISNDCLIRF